MFQIILSETTMDRAFIFDIKHNLVNFYQVCSNYLPRANTGTALGEYERIFMSETSRSRALIVSMKHYRVDHNQVCSKYALWAKVGAALGSHDIGKT